MPKRLHLKDHLTLDELEQHYRQARDPVARSHYQIVWLVGQGRLTREVAAITGYSPNWIGQLVRRYNAHGPDGLGDGRQHNPGAPPLLSPAQQAKLRVALAEPPHDGGLWTSAKVAAWIKAETGREVAVTRGWEYLRQLGYTPQVPRPRHPKADATAQEAFKKNAASRLTTLRQAAPEATVELWAEDEHRLGLKPLLRRVWAPKGQRPLAPAHHRYEWLYVYGFVRPTTGETAWLLLPRVNAALFSLALAHFAGEVGAGPTKQILLVLDQAGFHVSGDVVIPQGIHVEFLPPYSPELQPAERLWPLTNEAVANRYFADIAALEDQVAGRCRTLSEQPDVIRAHTRFHWWPTEKAA